MPSLADTSYGFKAVKPYVSPPATAYSDAPLRPAAPQPAGGPANTLAIPGSGTPLDYASLAQNDPIYQTWARGRDLGVSNAGTARRAALRSLALDYGGLPPGTSDDYGDLTPDILGQAAANPESTLAQMQRSYDAQNATMQNQLAARGALHSGDLVAGQAALNQQQQLDQYNAGRAFGSNLTSAIGDYTNQVAQAGAGESDALQAAIQDQMALNPVSPDQQSANLVANWQTNFGRPMYSAPNGDLYTPDPGTGQLVLYATKSDAPEAYGTGYVFTGV